ncbi:MAG: peptidoglycan bridge formation glycyltransferase FemA/FemB family protein, partial [Patescibacteria group bacterium]
EAFDLLIRELKKIAKEENAVFIRIAPSEKKSEEGMGVLGALGLRPSPIHTHAELLWLLDLSPSEENLLKNMRKQTRYSIQKAGKDGVLVEISAKPEDAERFYEIYETTAQEQKFHAFSREYIASEFKAFAGAGSVKFFFARYKGEIVSAAMIIFSKHEAFYHHGASLKKYPQLTASHLLQWEVIREARRRGCRIYNFWGISPPDNRKHPWAGLSLFKRGFGGYAEEFISSHDLPLSYKYWLNFIVEKARKIRRGF